MAVLYTVDSNPSVRPLPVDLSLADEASRPYHVLSHAMLGTASGITAGILVTEPYTGQGSQLILTLREVALASQGQGVQNLTGTWSIPFVENRIPGTPIDHIEGGRVSPEIMSAGDVAMAIAGPPGGSLVKLLIKRDGQEYALYGAISDGYARGLSKNEFQALLASQAGSPTDFPNPPGWSPAPATP